MSRQELANNIWKACDIMRRDDGTGHILDYMEQISWMLFLKIFEDIEDRYENEYKIKGEKYDRIISGEYKWSSWTSKKWKGKELIEFIDGKLIPYLQKLGGTPEREMIAVIFKELRNKMRSPYNLKDVIDVVSKINFNNKEDSQILSQVYEDLLVRLGREGGIAGEFYTPRPIVRLMVKIVNPAIGKTVFDPFSGPCGFLVESYKLLLGSKEIGLRDYQTLQRKTFYAQEKLDLPFLLGIMNCILHGILTPNIVKKNTLGDNIRNLSERYDIVLTNPPFGGKEGENIQQNFPISVQATELLALQHVMKRLKPNGKCGIVVPEGVLFRGDAFAKVKKELIENFNVHTIVSLPSGVFANVTSSGQGPKTNLLFFDKTGSTKEIWYYELLPPNGKNYTKANPVTDDDLKECYEKWKIRKISDNSWIVNVKDIVKQDYDMTAKNPKKKQDFEHRPPEQLVADVLERERQIQEILEEVQELLVKENASKSNS